MAPRGSGAARRPPTRPSASRPAARQVRRSRRRGRRQPRGSAGSRWCTRGDGDRRHPSTAGFDSARCAAPPCTRIVDRRRAIPILRLVPAEESSQYDFAVEELIDRELEESPGGPRCSAVTVSTTGSTICRPLRSSAGPTPTASGCRRFAAFEPDRLAPEEAIDRALIAARARRARLDRRLAGLATSPEDYLETGITELFLLRMHSEDELTDAAVDRLRGIGRVLDEAVENLDPSLASTLIVERGIAQCDGSVTFARTEVSALAESPANRARLEEAGEGRGARLRAVRRVPARAGTTVHRELRLRRGTLQRRPPTGRAARPRRARSAPRGRGQAPGADRRAGGGCARPRRIAAVARDTPSPPEGDRTFDRADASPSTRTAASRRAGSSSITVS